MISNVTPHIPKQPSGTSYYHAAPVSNRSVSPNAEKSVADAMLTLSAQRPEATNMAYSAPSIYPPQHHQGYQQEYGRTTPPNLQQRLQQQQQQQQRPQYPQQQQKLLEPIVVKPEMAEMTENMMSNRHPRKHREFIPEGNKDECYWSKRRKNNEAAKRSREKRRLNDMAMGQRILDLTNENTKLKQEVAALKKVIGYPLDKVFVGPSGEGQAAQPDGPSLATTPVSQVMHHASMHAGESREHPIPPGPPPIPLQVQFNNMPMLLPAMPSQQNVFNPPDLINTMATSSTAAYSSSSSSPVHVASELSQSQVSQSEQPVAGTGVYSIEPISPASVRDCVSPDSRSDSPHSLKISLSGESSDSETSDHEGKKSKSGAATTAPLNLSTRHMDEGYSTNDSSSTSDLGPDEKKRECTSIPHKLRHKMSNNDSFIVTRQQVPYPTSNPAAASAADAADMINRVSTHEHTSSMNKEYDHTSSMNEEYDHTSSMNEEYDHTSSMNTEYDHTSSVNDEYDHLSSVNDEYDQASSLNDSYGDESMSEKGKLDPRYLERRRRNNMAARKCRENRKRMSELRMAKSDVLETENCRLQNEIHTLSSEIHNLRSLLDRKKEAQAKGQEFTPPPLEELAEPRH